MAEVKAPKNIEEILEQEIIDREEADVKLRQLTIAETKVHEVVTRLVGYYESYIFPEVYEIIKANNLYNADVKRLLECEGIKNRSCSVYPLITPIYDSFKANLYDTESIPTVIPRFKDFQEHSEEAQDFYNWSYDVSKAEDAEVLARNEASLIGTSYMIGGIKNLDNTVFSKRDGKIKSEIISENHPTTEHISFFELFIEPSSPKFKGANKFRRRIDTLSNIAEKYIHFFELTDDDKDEIIASTNWVSSCDYTRIYEISNYTDLSQFDASSIRSGVFLFKDLFNVLDREDTHCEVIEYRNGERLVIMVNGFIFYDDINPYPDCDPFEIIIYEEKPGTFMGTGIGHKLISHQKQANFYYNAIHDAVQIHIRPMFTGTPGGLKSRDGTVPDTLEYEEGRIRETEVGGMGNGGLSPIQTVDYNIVNIARSRLAEIKQEAEVIAGINSLILGGQGKVDRVSGAVKAKLGVTKMRLKPINRSIGKMQAGLFYTWTKISTVLLSKSIDIRILGEGKTKFTSMKIENIHNKFDIVLSNETNITNTKLERVQSTIQALQTLLPNGQNIDQLTNTPYINPRELLKEGLDILNFKGVDIMGVDETKRYIDNAFEIQSYIQGKAQPKETNEHMQRNPNELTSDQIPPEGILLPPQ